MKWKLRILINGIYQGTNTGSRKIIMGIILDHLIEHECSNIEKITFDVQPMENLGK